MDGKAYGVLQSVVIGISISNYYDLISLKEGIKNTYKITTSFDFPEEPMAENRF